MLGDHLLLLSVDPLFSFFNYPFVWPFVAVIDSRNDNIPSIAFLLCVIVVVFT